MWLLQFLLFLSFSCIVYSAPMVHEQSSNFSLVHRRPVWETFLGIDWSGVLGPDCSDRQRAIIDDAVWNAYYEVLLKTIASTGSAKVDLNPSWNRFFMNDNEADWGNGWTTRGDVRGQAHQVFDRIRGNFEKAIWFYPTGKVDGKGKLATEMRKLSYSCKEFEFKGRCERRGSGAYTSHPQVTESGKWRTTFCPKFFSSLVEPIKEIASRRGNTVADLPNLMSREHVVIHEWMHCGLPKFPISIVDQNWNGNDVYGAEKCHEYAWKNAKTHDGKKLSPRAINMDVELNADSYAWYLTNRWFQGEKNWDDPGKGRDVPSLKKVQSTSLAASHPDNQTIILRNVTILKADLTSTAASLAAPTELP